MLQSTILSFDFVKQIVVESKNGKEINSIEFQNIAVRKKEKEKFIYAFFKNKDY